MITDRTQYAHYRSHRDWDILALDARNHARGGEKLPTQVRRRAIARASALWTRCGTQETIRSATGQ
jgi:hypothetical protein